MADEHGPDVPPSGPNTRFSGSMLALILVGILVVAGIAVGAMAAGGVFSHNAAVTFTSTTANAPPVQTVTNSVTRTATQSAPSPGSPAGGTTSCGGDLSVGSHTSCAFARNVEAAYDQSSGGDVDVTAYSPATGQTYTIHCTSAVPHVCSGGTTNGASIYFTSGPGQGGSAPAGTTSCGSGIYVGPNASCGFAKNVESAYYQAGGGNINVTAYSPSTGQTYVIYCTDSSPHYCSGGTTNNAALYFP